MEKLTTSIDQHGRMLIPSHIRERFNINPGEKVTLEIEKNHIKIINAENVIDEIHALFTKNQTIQKDSVVDDFISQKRKENLIEQKRSDKID